MKSAPHKWHYTYSRGVPDLREVAMEVLSKPTGAGAPERNWADFKMVFDQHKARTGSDKLEKKVKIYGETRRNIVLTGDDSGDIGDTWKETDEVFEGLGLEKWGYAAVDDLTEEITRPRRQFKCLINKEEKRWVLTEKRVEEAMLIKKYKGIRFYDANEGDGTYYRVRSDSFSWKGKRWGGWAASCDAMPSGDPSEDPKADMDITNDYEPVDYAINDSLIDMAECADQAPGFVLMSEELGERKSENEEDGEEEDGDE